MVYDYITEEMMNFWIEWALGNSEAFIALVFAYILLTVSVVLIFLLFCYLIKSIMEAVCTPKQDDFIEYCFKKDGIPLASDVEEYFIEYCRFYDEVKRVRKFYSNRKNYKKYIEEKNSGG